MDIKIAEQIFDVHNVIIKIKEIREHKIYDRFLRKLIADGYVEKV